jgi:nitroreductase
MTSDQCPPIQKGWRLGQDEIEHFMRARRSIRVYKDKDVDRQTLTRLIEIARFAPSGHNTQPVRWLVVYDCQEVRRLAGVVIEWMRHMLKEQSPLAKALHMDRVVARWETGVDTICRGAPHVIVAHARTDERPAPQACIIALAHLELAASAFGLGACWAGYFNTAATLWPPMHKELGLPEGHASFGVMMIGYPRYRYHRLPLRKEARITWR